MLFSRAGEAIAQVAMPLLVYDLTGSSRLLGLMLVISLAPRVVLAPLTGLLADRLDRRRLMIAAAVIRAATVPFIPIVDEIWQIGALALVISSAVAVSAPAELSALPLTVPEEQLVTALSITQVTNNIVRIVGPAVGAGLVGTAGFGPAFVTEAACFMGVIGCLIPLSLPRSDRPRAPLLAGAKRDMAKGLGVVWRTPIVRGITGAECLWAFLGAAMTIAGLVYLEEVLDLGGRADFAYGLLSASLSAGAVTGALIANRVERRIGRPTMLAAGYLGPLFVVPALLEPSLVPLVMLWALLGCADALAVIAMQAYLAESVGDELRGRVYATWNAVITLAALISYGAVGWITGRLGAPATIAMGGVLVGAGGPLLLILSGAIAAVRRPATESAA